MGEEWLVAQFVINRELIALGATGAPLFVRVLVRTAQLRRAHERAGPLQPEHHQWLCPVVAHHGADWLSGACSG